SEACGGLFSGDVGAGLGSRWSLSLILFRGRWAAGGNPNSRLLSVICAFDPVGPPAFQGPTVPMATAAAYSSTSNSALILAPSGRKQSTFRRPRGGFSQGSWLPQGQIVDYFPGRGNRRSMSFNTSPSKGVPGRST